MSGRVHRRSPEEFIMQGGVERRYVTIGGRRQVHYRRVGSGPPVVLLHSSPQSADFVVPALLPLTGEMTLIGLDTPGYGGSDPLPMPEPTAADYARGVAETLDALGIRRCPIYGTHTGAHIAMAFALLYPERTSIVVLDGISFNFPAEKVELLQTYAPPFTPTAGGEHLAWAWQHTRDQMIFYPWFRAEKDHRLASAVADPAYIHKVVLWKMAAGSYYRMGYRAAFSHDSLAGIRQMTANTIVVARSSDILASQAVRLENLPACVRVINLPESREQWLVAMRQAFLQHGDATIGVAPTPTAGKSWADYVRLGDSERLVRRAGSAKGKPLVLLHGEMGSSAVLADLMVELGSDRPVMAIDVAGCAESEPLGVARPTLADFAADVVATLDRAGVGQADLYGDGIGALLALAVAERLGTSAGKVVLDRPVSPSDAERTNLIAHFAPAIEPRWDGTHFLTAWHMLRDGEFFWPWYRRTREGVRWAEPAIDPGRLQRRLIEWLKAPATYGDYCRAAFAAAADQFGGKRPVLVLGSPGDRLHSHAERLAAVAPHRQLAARPVGARDIAKVIAAFLS
ncbi:MAG: alpha/beta hydrolase [Alphaproteobacteria bacterium]|nr:alpha/beta hydrolase [Alphaproteobacteria bacterium]